MKMVQMARSSADAASSMVPLSPCLVWCGGLPRIPDCGLVHRSAHRLLDELRDPGLVCLGQLLQREGDGPHGAVVELRAVVEAEHRVPLLELRGVAEEADDLAVLVRVRGHSVPGLRREVRGALFDERM